ncbi:MAG: Gldg family protein [Oligoflexales bacterium]
MSSLFKIIRLPAIVLGLIVFFVAERYLNAEAYALYMKAGAIGLMVLGILATVGLFADCRRKGFVTESKYYLYMLLWMIPVALSPLIYLAYLKVMGTKAVPDLFIEKALLGAWLLFLVIGIFVGIGFELGYRQCGRGDLAEPRPMQRSGLNWMLVGMVFSSLVALNYGFAKRDKVYDWSYFKATAPGEASINMVKNLDKPVEIGVFYPQTNEVRPLVAEYIDALAKNSSKITVQYFDTDLHPAQAEAFKVSRNGQVVLKSGDQRELVDVGLEIKDARSKLRKFDSLFQKSFLELTTEKKNAYFMQGHGEMATSGGENPLRSVSGLEMVLRSQNYAVKKLDVGAGFAEIPHDAGVVIIAGPTKYLLAEEVQVLKDYVNRGGSLVLFLDDDVFDSNSVPALQQTDPLKEFLEKEVGVNVIWERMANDKQYVAASRSSVDKWFIYTNVFSSHESVQNLSKNDDKLQLLFFRAGHLQSKPSNNGWKNVDTVKTIASSFADKNRDYTFNEGAEVRKPYVLGVASELDIKGGETPSKARIVTFADSTMASDFLLRNPGNQLAVLDTIKWIMGDAKISGEIASEEDVKIRHSRARDLFVFHGSIFFVPVLFLIAGYFATRKRKPRRVGDE